MVDGRGILIPMVPSLAGVSDAPNFFASTKFFACLDLKESQQLYEASQLVRTHGIHLCSCALSFALCPGTSPCTMTWHPLSSQRDMSIPREQEQMDNFTLVCRWRWILWRHCSHPGTAAQQAYSLLLKARCRILFGVPASQCHCTRKFDCHGFDCL
jgi:hypothetical protein